MLKAAMSHNGLAFIDVISPCVTFNNSGGSTKSYEYVRDHQEATGTVDFVPFQKEIITDYREGANQTVTMHDGSQVVLHKGKSDLDVTNRITAMHNLGKEKEQGRILTGVIYIDPIAQETHDIINSCERHRVRIRQCSVIACRSNPFLQQWQWIRWQIFG